MDGESLGSFDVAISGAGPAGASLALRLARRGLRVALLDAGQFPRDKLCGEFLSPEGVQALERLGLGGALARCRARTIGRVRLTTPSGRALEATLPDGRSALGLSRAVLDTLLIAEARQAGVRVVEQARVGGPLVEEGRVAGLAARSADQGRMRVRAKVTVAASGRHSTLVGQTGRTRFREWVYHRRDFGLKCHLLSPGHRTPDAVTLHLLPGGYVGTCQVEGGLVNLCGLLPEALLRRYRGDLQALTRAVFNANPELARLWASASPTGPWKTVAGVRVEISTPRFPGIFYAGDCQGTVDPLAGQGITMALLGAEALVPFILRAVGAGLATSALQREAQAAWRRRFDRRVRLCRLFHQVLVRPGIIDFGARLGGVGGRLLATAYGWTRDVSGTSA
jgi:flavin-dependent dehydrogenase